MKPWLVLGCHMLILLKRPCSIPNLSKMYRNEFSRFFTVVEVCFRREKTETMRWKLDVNQMRDKEGNKTRIHMKARSNISHTGRRTVSVFVSVNSTPKAPKSAVPNRQRVNLLVLKVFYSNKTLRKSVSSEKPVWN